jgi:hypothetical protein
MPVRCAMWRFIAAMALALPLAGCGSEGPPRYELSGTVTFDGKPVPKGFITFTPDTEKGNDGPGGGAEIIDGKYRTESGKGIIGGPHNVRIVGYDGIPARVEGEDLPDGKSLFAPHQEKIDFPKQDREYNFAIAKAGK